jgi:phospholipase/carboxylesterase
MDDREVDDLTALLPPLLQALESLAFVARHLNPPDLQQVVAAIGEPEAEVAALRPRLDQWPSELAQVRAPLDAAAGAVAAAFAELRAAAATDDLGQAYRALRHAARADEALYPLAQGLPPLSRYFLPPAARADQALAARLAEAPGGSDTGVFHIDNERGARGGVSLYVPETYDAETPAPLVVALHGGSGHGRSFLWTWLREARARGAILVSPTSAGGTWALSGTDLDSPRLAEIVAQLGGRWNVDPDRRLLTGMSDGGTFAYVSGLEADSPFTHLAPIAAAFHPMLAQFADPDRLRGLPIHIAHGALDWMFPVAMADEARMVLTAAGADVTYREIADLSHTYPRELNGEILDWMDRTAGRPAD